MVCKVLSMPNHSMIYDSSEILLPHRLQLSEVIPQVKEGEMKSLCGLQIVLGVGGSLEQRGPVLGAFRTCKHCVSSTTLPTKSLRRGKSWDIFCSSAVKRNIQSQEKYRRQPHDVFPIQRGRAVVNIARRDSQCLCMAVLKGLSIHWTFHSGIVNCLFIHTLISH